MVEMDKYDKLKEQIEKEYIYGEVVEANNDVVSMYDLVYLLEEKFEALRVVKDGSYLKEKINQDRTVQQMFSFFRKKTIVDGQCLSIISDFNKSKCRVSFSFENVSQNREDVVVIMKDSESDDLYFEDSRFANREFAEKYISEIYEMFGVLENFAKYYPASAKGGVSSITQTFKAGILEVLITVFPNGKIECNITPSNGVDNQNIYNREWLSREKLSNYVKENRANILQSIPVELDSLNTSFRTIVEESKEKRDVKKLVK
jgi:hypothetical protein